MYLIRYRVLRLFHRLAQYHGGVLRIRLLERIIVDPSGTLDLARNYPDRYIGSLWGPNTAGSTQNQKRVGLSGITSR